MTREEAKKEIEKVFEPAFANYIIKALTDGATESDMPCEDAISREEALECFPMIMQGELFTVETIRHQLKKLPSVKVEPQEWISVKDRLPKDAEAVLITIRRMDKSFNQIPFISVGYISWNQQAWWCAHDGDCKENNIEVLAWMPLPSPYKGE